GSDAEGGAEPLLAGAGHAERPRAVYPADPVQVEAARGQRRAQGTAEMRPSLAPVEAWPAEHADLAALCLRRLEVEPELAEESRIGIGPRAPLCRQVEEAALGHRVGQPHRQIAGEVVVAGARRPHRLVARPGDDGAAAGASGA